MSQQLIVRAKHTSSSVYVYLSKDCFGRKSDGSVYYWSNNMGLGVCLLFDNPEEAMKKIGRLKIKSQVIDIEVVPFEPGVQIVYLDGRYFPEKPQVVISPE